MPDLQSPSWQQPAHAMGGAGAIDFPRASKPFTILSEEE
jgi:hypothetical protein